ncbi:von Willebrand factor type A domain-containing protein [Luteolibacter flavescens]|uniref:von Willebrand factor type A domain-containing protein n=1 Tax=Luteolibacter flavescens TaxID=1859460 RepID=A0ABT3FTU0_9BACT|nr:von Willebrand factor type A domain-containing protein [Luteolibacter flavescens]MCW1886952.1 von Willebrand factor type A domain-containing protein [Luteolibacter flavescens]
MDKPLNPVGDAALEARITAWVLGEASPFEAAELEEICARDAGARLFEQRLRVLHAFITEDRKAGPDDEWKLPAEKRVKIEELLEKPVDLTDEDSDGEEDAIRTARKRASIRRTGRQALLAIAACTVVSFGGWTLMNSVGKSSTEAFAMQSSAEVMERGPSREDRLQALEELRKAVVAQQDKVDDKRKFLAHFNRDERIAFFPDGNGRSLDEMGRIEAHDATDALKSKVANQSVADAKTDFESSQQVLLELKRKLVTEEMAMQLSEGEFAQAAPAAEVVPSSAPLIAARESKALRITAEDDSLASLSDESTARSKSRPSGPPVKKPASSYLHLSQSSPYTSKPALQAQGRSNMPRSETASPAPANAALPDTAKELADNDAFAGKSELRDGTQPEIASRFRKEAPAAAMDGFAPADRPAELGIAGGSVDPYADAASPEQPAERSSLLADSQASGLKSDLSFFGTRRDSTDKPAAPNGEVNGIATAGNRSGAGAINRNNIDAILEGGEIAGAFDSKRSVNQANGYRYSPGNEVAQTGDFTDLSVMGELAKNAKDQTQDGFVDDPIRNNPALIEEHEQNPDDIRRNLYIAEGHYHLGRFDDANKSYEEVLRIDPYNKAARRGIETVAKAREDYYRAAYDQTRATLLAEVDRAWELPVPPSTEEAAEKSGEAPKPEEKAEVSQQEKKDAPAVELKAETQTSAEPFSTFSLHVSDASFKMAKAALERGDVPAPDGIRPEEFYNGFDYGDPAPANGEPVVCAVEQSAHPALPQRNLMRIGVKTGSQGRGGSTPLNLTLLLDSSGSMEREDRNAGLANAVRELSGLLKEGDTVSVIGFARQPRLLVDRLPGNRAQELNGIFAQTPSEGGTNLEEGLKLGEELAMRQFNPAAQNRIVLFTDGAANLGDAKPETLQAKVEQMRQNGIAFDAAGFGADGLNDKLLERLTRNGNGRYYIVDSAEEADASFAKQLAGAFRPAAENVKVQVRFNPARVAKYKLIGFEEHRLEKEDFRNDAVDAAEMAAEEAGNALYQIETLPRGEGEVGEVSVRFRDVASGQMVERTWTIPYDAQAPAFDQASPSIQLAGLSALAAEKLRRAPLADAVDFQQLAPVMAKVKARYAGSKPVADLESMIGHLK